MCVCARARRRIARDYSAIEATSADTSENDSDTVFWPVQVDGNVIRLRCDGNNNFCMRRTYNEDAFVAQASNISQAARIQVEELVLSREIYDVEFRIQNGRIYDQNIILAAKGYATNDSSSPLTHKLTLKHTETTSNTWQANVTLKLGVKTKINTGIPFLVGGEIEISAEASRSTTWGDTHKTSNELTNEYDAQVKPHSRVTVSLMATQGTCDVPFSYTQRDVYLDGRTVTTQNDDGLFTGVNTFTYNYDIKEEPLPNKPPAPPSTSSLD